MRVLSWVAGLEWCSAGLLRSMWALFWVKDCCGLPCVTGGPLVQKMVPVAVPVVCDRCAYSASTSFLCGVAGWLVGWLAG